MTATLTPRERELAIHALGLDRRKFSYRNYYVVGSGDDYATWRDMEQRGLAESWLPKGQTMVWFRLTHAGALAALEPGETLDSEDFPG
jgi:hypothetical protein